MKWTVAGAGALLCVAGVYALISGGSIIQVERGWATFIAGAVLVGAGAVVLGIAALMSRIDDLASLLRSSQGRTPPQAEAIGRLQSALQDVPQPTRRAVGDRTPTLKSPPPQPFAEAEFPPEAQNEPFAEQRPSALRDFQFVFPPADMTVNAPPPQAPEPAAPEPVQPLATAVSGRRAGLEWLRRPKEDPAPPAVEPTFEAPVASPVEPPVEEPAARAAPEPVNFAPAPPEPEPLADIAPAPAPSPTPPPAPTPAKPASPAVSDPLGADWLERALAGSDEEETASRAPPFLRRASGETRMGESAQTPVAKPEAAKPEAAKPEAAEPEAAPAAPAPIEIGRYRANDVAYVMFSDGSITAETPSGGSYRFNSLPELRAFIERGGA